MRNWALSFKALSFNERMTIILASASLMMAIVSGIVSVAALVQSLLSKDLSNAVTQLQKLSGYSFSQAKSLSDQQSTLRGQLAAQSEAASELGKQAAEATKQSILLSSQLALSQKQLNASLRSLSIYEENSKLAALDNAQEYRRISLSVLPIRLPTESDVGSKYTASIVFTNEGRYPVPVEDYSYGVVLTNENPTKRAGELFADAKRNLNSENRSYRTVSSSEPLQVNVGLGIGEDVPRFIEEGYRVLVWAIFAYRDPRGKLHHDYICRFSDKSHENQSCQTPLPD